MSQGGSLLEQGLGLALRSVPDAERRIECAASPLPLQELLEISGHSEAHVAETCSDGYGHDILPQMHSGKNERPKRLRKGLPANPTTSLSAIEL